MKTEIEVAGMHCDGCDSSIAKAIERLDGVSAVRADHRTGRVEVEHADAVDRTALEGAIEDAGYDVVRPGERRLPMA